MVRPKYKITTAREVQQLPIIVQHIINL